MRSRITHPLNVSYLVVGLVFLGISGIWALRAGGVVDTDQLGWLLPLTLVGAGAVGVLALGARSISRGHGRDSAAEADELDTDLTRELPVDTTGNTTGDLTGDPVRHDTRGDLR